jgi:hypothetical protein
VPAAPPNSRQAFGSPLSRRHRAALGFTLAPELRRARIEHREKFSPHVTTTVIDRGLAPKQTGRPKGRWTAALLGPFPKVLRDEALALMALSSFLLLTAYYLLKTVRGPLMLFQGGPR